MLQVPALAANAQLQAPGVHVQMQTALAAVQPKLVHRTRGAPCIRCNVLKSCQHGNVNNAAGVCMHLGAILV